MITAVTILLSLTVFLNNISKSLPKFYRDLDDVPLISMQKENHRIEKNQLFLLQACILKTSETIQELL
jgi:hypothetical protein